MKKEAPIHAPASAIASLIAEMRSQLIAILPETIEKEDAMTDGELAAAAAVYTLAIGEHRQAERATVRNWFWPWQREAFRPSTYRATLLHAAVLIVAEIERIDRAAANAAHILDGEKPAAIERGADNIETSPGLER